MPTPREIKQTKVLASAEYQDTNIINPRTGIQITADQIDWCMRCGQPDLLAALLAASEDLRGMIINGWRIGDLLQEAAARINHHNPGRG